MPDDTNTVTAPRVDVAVVNDDATHKTHSGSKPAAIHINVDSRVLILPTTAALIGAFIGFRRGARSAALRFLAENAHRTPTTVQGWYFYNKTKNYRVLLEGAKDAARNGGFLGASAAGWVAVEQGIQRLGPPWDVATEVAAGTSMAAVYSTLYRLPWKTTSRTLLLGASVGALISGLQAFRAHFEPLREELRKTKEATKVDSGDQTEGGEVGTASSKRDADSR